MKSVYLLVLSSLILFCSTATDFERDNENDPGASVFVANTSGLTAKLMPNRSVRLQWTDESNYELGFLIAKSYDGRITPIVIDTVQADVESYIDASGIISSTTVYSIAPFSENNPDPETWLESEIEFQDFSISSITSSGANISISWDTTSVFADSYKIEQRYPGKLEWTAIANVSGNNNSITFEEKRNIYSSHFRVAAEIASNNEIHTISNTDELPINYNLPKNISFKLLNEAELQVDFEDGSSFEDQFIVYLRFKENRCCDISPGPYITVDTIAVNSVVRIPKGDFFGTLEFSLEAINDEDKSPKTGYREISYGVNQPYFSEQANFTHLSNNSARISWNSADGTVDRYHFEVILKNSDSNETVDSVIVDKDTFTHTFNNLDTNTNYSYKVTTYNSRSNTHIDFEYLSNLVTVNSNNLTNVSIGKSQTEANSVALYYSTSVNGSALKKIRLTDGNTVSDLDNSEEDPGFENSYITDFLVSEDETNLITIRRVTDPSDGTIENWMYISQMENDIQEFVKKRLPGESDIEQIKLLSPMYNNRILFSYYDSINTGIFEYSLESDSIHQIDNIQDEDFNDVLIDQHGKQTLIAGQSKLWSYNWGLNELTLVKNNFTIDNFSIAVRNESVFGFVNNAPFLIDLNTLTVNRYSLRLSFNEAIVLGETLVTSLNGTNCYYDFSTTVYKLCKQVEFWGENNWWVSISSNYFDIENNRIYVLFSNGRLATYKFEDNWVIR